MTLWNLTFIEPLGRKLAHTPLAVVADTAKEAEAKMLAYIHPKPDPDRDYSFTYPNPATAADPVTARPFTVEIEEAPAGVIQGATFFTDRS